MSVKEAVETIVAALESDPGYRISWQANIAMAFKDEMARDGSNIHEAANRAADNFLRLLCYRAALPSAGKEEPRSFDEATMGEWDADGNWKPTPPQPGQEK